MLSEREQRIDAEELEDFLEVERLEHEAHVQEDKEEREATEAQKQYYGSINAASTTFLNCCKHHIFAIASAPFCKL